MRRLAAIVFADVAGWSRLVETNDAQTLLAWKALRFKPWALDFAPDNYAGEAFPKQAIFDPVVNNLHWTTEDWDPALRFWTLPWDPNLSAWLQGQDTSLPSILAAREFAAQHAKWRFTTAQLKGSTDVGAAPDARGWLTDSDHLKWQTVFNPFITAEIDQLFMMMEDDRDRYLAEIHAQADGLPGYIIHFIWADGDRKSWTIELIRCGLAIGNLVYMNYKAQFRRVRPSRICPGLVPPFGPPRHPSFPSGHSFLGHFIALLLLEIPEIAVVFGEPVGVAPMPLGKPLLNKVMSNAVNDVFAGPLLWLAARLATNRERLGVHYHSDSMASRWMAGAIAALLTGDMTKPTNAVNPVTAADLIDCPTLQRVLLMAKAEWT